MFRGHAGGARCSRSAHWGSELSASDVLVVNTKQDCSDSSNPAAQTAPYASAVNGPARPLCSATDSTAGLKALGRPRQRTCLHIARIRQSGPALSLIDPEA